MTEREEPAYERDHGELPPDYPLPAEELAKVGGEIAWANEEGAALRPAFVPIMSPKPNGGGVSGIFINQRFQGVWTHWFDWRTGPHIDPPEICPGCRNSRPRRRKGYALVLDGNFKIGLLEITQEVLRLSPFLTSPAAALRGRRFRCVRVGQDRNSRVCLTVEAYRPGDSELLQNMPPDDDVRPLLRRIWEI